MTKQQRYNYSAKHIRRMKLFERQFLKSVFNALHTQITPIVNILNQQGIEAAQNALNTIFINAHIIEPINEIYKTVGVYFANKTIYDINQSAREVKQGFGFNEQFIMDILHYFKMNLLDQVVLSISETTKNQILKVISEGILMGWGAEKIAKTIGSPELTMWRARMIVRTEANKAMNYGQILGESKSEWESNKIWIAANDHRTRHSHRDMDDKMIPFKDKYLVPVYKSVGGIKGKKKGIEMQIGVDLMSAPGDKNASAGNVINCRCTVAFQAKRDENGRLIRKATAAPVMV